MNVNFESASVLLLALLVSSGPFVGVAAAEPGATLKIRPGGASGTATYVATVEIDERGVGALESFEMHLGAAGADVKTVPPRAVTVAGIDRGADDPGTRVDVSVREDLSGVNVRGDTVEVHFDGTNQLDAGDELVVVIEGVATPPPGTHTVPVGVNKPDESALVNATVTVPQAAGSTTTPASTTGTAGAATTGEGETTTDRAEPMDLTSSPVPGFGATAAAVAVLAAAACAARVSRRR